MNLPTRIVLRALIPALSLFWGSTADAACRYRLKSTQLLQCHLIKRIENTDRKAVWTYADGQPNQEGDLAHILCRCETAAVVVQPACEAPRAHKMTFTLPTEDIQKTCNPGAALCEDPCRKLINQQ